MVLSGCAGLFGWQVLSPFLSHTPAEPQGAALSIQSSPALPHAALIAHIQSRHLFGEPTPAAVAPVLASNGSVSVMGIVYSSVARDSVALLSVAGNAVVCRIGTRLSTGETVTDIQPDRVQFSGGGRLTSVLIDIKQADPNQRTGTGQYTMVSAGEDATNISIDAGSSQPSVAQSTPNLSPAPMSFAPTHFVSLKSLRGAPAAHRFSNMDMPKSKHGPRH